MAEKTNVMRILDQKKIKYSHYEYDTKGDISGEAVAGMLKQNPAQVFKTLVTVSKSGVNYVFIIPVNQELDLKKAAKAVGEKSVAMIKSKELLPLTGYIHGGCSPIGMKKYFITTVDLSAKEYQTIFFSAGKIGIQVELSLESLKKVIRFELCDLVENTALKEIL
ncbi:Cys-tRNA(Pro) deacylase [Eubacteriaceae bacterium ES3]|nr:Cys-tRNA(Pro) deacylase [Eubacteriaceae bacterium ES3]